MPALSIPFAAIGLSGKTIVLVPPPRGALGPDFDVERFALNLNPIVAQTVGSHGITHFSMRIADANVCNIPDETGTGAPAPTKGQIWPRRRRGRY